ncbi:hypothetical protein SAMN05518849_101562 [Sphingobium sp. AP50]|uniref:hypothetical protein n=1 Tax=Sphingobium sp. AP50 TaxID=1884369 RepID=UPI0008C85956|nr:hypothetical protein [Sphingobium sp. AP50]SEI68839.1 hypothetical protein SAMN05518849_101562 [Sphingobium sp. AP50]
MKAVDRIWSALAAPDGVTSIDVAQAGLASESHARRLLHRWAEAGLIERTDKSVGRSDAHLYRRTASSPQHSPGLTAEGEVFLRDPAMTAAEFAIIRRRTGHSLASLGRALGWTGKQPSISRAMRRFEDGDRMIDADLAARIRAVAPA